MNLKPINRVCMYEDGERIDNDGIYGNPNYMDFDVDDRSHWTYVGLTDEEFEGKKKVVANCKKRRAGIPDDGSDDGRNIWDFPNNHNSMGGLRFFEVRESETDAEPVAYLAVQLWNTPHDDCNRSLVLASEVKGWKMGKIQALLMNRMLAPTYVGRNWNGFRYNDEHRVVPFGEGHGITASAEGFNFCKSEQKARLSSIEIDAIGE